MPPYAVQEPQGDGVPEPWRVHEDEAERRPDGGTVRVLRQEGVAGRRWRVWVADTRLVPGAARPRCLIYDSGTCLRRVWAVPDDWERMRPAALLALAEQHGAGTAGEARTPAPRTSVDPGPADTHGSAT